MPDDVKWTAREAMACALCWVEFSSPEKTGFASPETYWLGLPEATRNLYRRSANKRLLLAVARGEAVPMLPPGSLTGDDETSLMQEMGLQQKWRANRLAAAVHRWFARRCADA